MKKPITFTEEAIYQKAYELFTLHGLEYITARKLAAALNCSPAPIYRCYNSLDDLKNLILNDAINKFTRYVTAKYSDSKFMSLAIGYCLFAFEHPVLFRAIFLNKERDIYDEKNPFIQVLRNIVKKEKKYANSDRPVSEHPELFQYWIYIHGLAAIMAFNLTKSMNIIDPKEFITEKLKNSPIELLNRK